MSLTTVAAVASILGRDPGDLTAEETTRITELIDLAAAEIDGYLGRPAEGGAAITENVNAGAWRTRVPLTRWPVDDSEDVTVTIDGTPLEDGDFILDPRPGILHRLGGGWPLRLPARYGPDYFTVTYTPATIEPLAALAARMAARAFRAATSETAVPAAMTGLRQLTIGRWSGTRETRGSDPVDALVLTDADMAIVDRWVDRRP